MRVYIELIYLVDWTEDYLLQITKRISARRMSISFNFINSDDGGRIVYNVPMGLIIIAIR